MYNTYIIDEDRKYGKCCECQFLRSKIDLKLTP